AGLEPDARIFLVAGDAHGDGGAAPGAVLRVPRRAGGEGRARRAHSVGAGRLRGAGGRLWTQHLGVDRPGGRHVRPAEIRRRGLQRARLTAPTPSTELTLRRKKVRTDTCSRGREARSR